MQVIKTARGQFATRLTDGAVLTWGWRFRSARDPFKKAIGTTPVTVFAEVSRMGQPVQALVPETVVGHARLMTEAARIGRDALRERVMGPVRAFAAGA